MSSRTGNAGEAFVSHFSIPTNPPSHKPKISELHLQTISWRYVASGIKYIEELENLKEDSYWRSIGNTYAVFITVVLAGVTNDSPISVVSDEYGDPVYAQDP